MGFLYNMLSGGGDYSNMEWGMVYGYASMLLAFILIFVAIKQYRDKVSGGTISFGKAFLVGLYVTLIASTVYVLTWMVYYNNFAPDFMDKYAEYVIADLREKGAAEAEIQAQTAEMQKYSEMYKNPLFVFLFTYIEILPVGLLISLVAALILKRRTPRSEQVAA